MTTGYKRLSMSFAPETLLWINELLVTLRRGGDPRVLMRADEALVFARVLLPAITKAKAMGSKPPRKKPPTYKHTKCRHGHVYPDDKVFSDGRRCKICKEAADERSRQRFKSPRDRTLRHAQQDAAADRLLEARRVG